MEDKTPPPQPPHQNDPYYNTTQASKYLGNTPLSSIRQYTAQRRLPCYKPGKIVLYRKSDLDAFVQASHRKSIAQLTQGLEQKRQELSGPTTGGAVKGKGSRS
ncbi:hypothetical protein BEN49_13175 [Hymenobacter coccineus]|uniref:Helix-turn-helix domain-containing protein n=2 Tax=Hymenobacter coccineus TaxID=1908235 RepID=A0A1G1SWA6_9BACT|nr:hypothetical protein BEN49_13175 [Hymenobacter coccineus]